MIRICCRNRRVRLVIHTGHCIRDKGFRSLRYPQDTFEDKKTLPYHEDMSITLPAAVIDRLPDLTSGALKTYVALSLLKSTDKEYPTQTDIAVKMNVSARSVRTYLNELEQAGYVERRRLGAGRRTDYALRNDLAYGGK